MKVMIAGYGRMGQLIEQTLLAETDEAGRPLHEVTARIDIDADESRGIYDASDLQKLEKCDGQKKSPS